MEAKRVCPGAAQEALRREMAVAWFEESEAVASFACLVVAVVRVAPLVMAAPLEIVA